MQNSPEQREFNFEEPKKPELPKIIEVKVEADEDKECGACGNLLAGRSRGCTQCSGNEIKKKWQNENPQKTSH